MGVFVGITRNSPRLTPAPNRTFRVTTGVFTPNPAFPPSRGKGSFETAGREIRNACIPQALQRAKNDRPTPRSDASSINANSPQSMRPPRAAMASAKTLDNDRPETRSA